MSRKLIISSRCEIQISLPTSGIKNSNIIQIELSSKKSVIPLLRISIEISEVKNPIEIQVKKSDNRT